MAPRQVQGIEFVMDVEPPIDGHGLESAASMLAPQAFLRSSLVAMA